MEINKEKVVDYVKTYATIAKDKVVATWKSGTKGKFACVVGAAIIHLGLKSCLTTSGSNTEGEENKSRLGPQYQFTAADFATESGTDALFYVKDGEDDGYKDVVPNYSKMPEVLSRGESLCYCFSPTPGEIKRKIGVAYFNDPDASFSYCVVDYIGDGWVIAKPNNMDLCGRNFGFIITSDGYVDGQELATGFYVFVGTEKVTRRNGSVQTLFAFEKLDDESNVLAIEAHRRNVKAFAAADKENIRRKSLREERKRKEKTEIYHKEVAKLFEGLSFKEFQSQLHFPVALTNICDAVEQGEKIGLPREYNWVTEAAFLSAVKNNEWDGFLSVLRCGGEVPEDDMFDPVKMAKDAYERVWRLTRHFSLLRLRERHYRFFIVDTNHTDQVSCVSNWDAARGVNLAIGADFYCVKDVDYKEFDGIKDGAAFVAAWNKKYGKE